MKSFMDKDFLLTTETSRTLFHDYAAECPIIDYHNHLSAKEIYERRTYENLTQLWLEADHYKWRCMRVCGIPEEYVTGDASDYEKFEAFATIMPRLIGSPVYHWAHMELQRYFDIDTPLSESTAKEIWDKTSALLQGEGFDAVSLLNHVDAKVLCTTDDPADDLAWHLQLKKDDELDFAVLPSFRPDRFLHIDQRGNWLTALQQLGTRYTVTIDSWETLLDALRRSLDFFQEAGCKVTDHGFTKFRYATGDPKPVFQKVLAGEPLTEEELSVYQGALLRFLAAEYAHRNLAMQLHLGPIRNNSPKVMKAFGPDGGGDSIGLATDPYLLGAFLGVWKQKTRCQRPFCIT